MIYLLDEDPTKNAQCLDDIALDEQIRAISQTLCNAYYKFHFNSKKPRMEIVPPLKPIIEQEYSGWAIACHANYLQLVEMGWRACYEWHYRFQEKCTADMQSWEEQYDCGGHHKMKPVIEWAQNNIPQLPDNYKKDTVTVELSGIKQKVLSPTLKQEMTHFPINIPAKYWMVEDPFPICDLVASHRKYYQAKLLKKKVKCKKCCGDPCIVDHYCKECGCTGFIKTISIWSRREKPEWLNLEGEK